MKSKEGQKFEPEFKIRIVKLILSKEKKISELARELKINENTIHVWKRKYFEELIWKLSSLMKKVMLMGIARTLFYSVV